MKKIIIFAGLASVLTFGTFNYLKKPGSELGVLATKAVTPKILNPKNNEVNEKSLDNFAKNTHIIISSPDKEKAIDEVVEEELNMKDNKLNKDELYALYNNSTEALENTSRSVADFMNDILGSK